MEGMTTEGRTVLFVSHNMAAVKSLCRRALWIDRGGILADGSPQETILSYINASTGSVADWEIAEDKHAPGNSKMRVRKIKAVGTSHRGSFTFFWKQPMELELEIEVLERVRDISFGLGVTALDGYPVFTVHHDDGQAGFWSLDPGNYTIHVVVENPLRAGIYRLVVGAHEGLAKTSVFFIPDALHFEILDIAGDSGEYVHHNAGVVNCSATWRIQGSQG
jgi:lipopolysaccharide transport system ATP-binding protein